MADVTSMKRAYRQHVAQNFRRATGSFERTLRATLPRGETGQLQNTFNVSVRSSGGDVLKAHAELPVKYAAMLDEGTDPHPIEPRRSGGVLVFKVNGVTVFTRHVDHPGFPSQEIWKKPAPVIWQSSLSEVF